MVPVRRCAVLLLSVFLSASGAPAAAADPICIAVGTDGDGLPDPLVAPFCVGYGGPVYCERNRVGFDPGYGVDVVACVPGG